MKITVEFNSWDEVVEFSDKIVSIDAEPEKDKPKRTRKSADKTESPNLNAGGPTAGSAGPASPSPAANAENPLAGLTGDNSSDLGSMLGLGAEPAKQLTVEEVRTKAQNLAQSAPKEVTNQIVKMIQSYGIKDISQMSQEQLNDFYIKLDTIKK